MAPTRTQKIAIIALFSSLVLASNYALTPFPNVKLFDSLVFVSSFLFGLDVGLSVAILSWFVYGSVNPWGTASLYLILILAASETVYAWFGWIAARLLRYRFRSGIERSLGFGIMGLVGALIYDVLTVTVPLIMIGNPLLTAFLYLLNPATLYFFLVHEVADLFFFSTFVPALIYAIRRVVPSWCRIKVEVLQVR